MDFCHLNTLNWKTACNDTKAEWFCAETTSETILVVFAVLTEQRASGEANDAVSAYSQVKVSDATPSGSGFRRRNAQQSGSGYFEIGV